MEEGPRAEECVQTLTVREGKERVLPGASREEKHPDSALTLAQRGSCQTSDPQLCKIMYLYLFKVLNLWQCVTTAENKPTNPPNPLSIPQGVAQSRSTGALSLALQPEFTGSPVLCSSQLGRLSAPGPPLPPPSANVGGSSLKGR